MRRYGDKRIIKKFLLFPRTIKGEANGIGQQTIERRWLEWAIIEQTFGGGEYWYDVRFVDELTAKDSANIDITKQINELNKRIDTLEKQNIEYKNEFVALLNKLTSLFDEIRDKFEAIAGYLGIYFYKEEYTPPKMKASKIDHNQKE